MATITACTSTSLVARAALVQKASPARPATVLGKIPPNLESFKVGYAYKWSKILSYIHVWWSSWSFQVCHQSQRWGEWDAPWRGSQRGVTASWGWVVRWWLQRWRRRCQARQRWHWWMTEWAQREQGCHSGWATTSLGGSCWVCLVWFGLSTSSMLPLLKRMRNQAYLFEPLLIYDILLHVKHLHLLSVIFSISRMFLIRRTIILPLLFLQLF